MPQDCDVDSARHAANDPAGVRLRPPGSHHPDTSRRAADRARAIVAAGPRTELVGAAEFLHGLLRTSEGPTGSGRHPDPGRAHGR